MRFQTWFSQTFQVSNQVRTPLLLNWLVTFVSILGLLTVYFVLQPEVPLFYSLAQPQDYLVQKEWLFVIPALSFSLNVLHTSLLKVLAHYEQVLTDIFIWTGLAIQVLLASALLRIVWLVL